MGKLSHVDKEGKARMVDVGEKEIQNRTAIASGFISLSEEAVKQVKENNNKKGDVLTIAEVAGIQAAKRTADLIPLCHTLLLNKVLVSCVLTEKGVEVTSEVRCLGKTGVEMEALTAVNIALLTIYDMCKAVDKNMVMSSIQLDEKKKEDFKKVKEKKSDNVESVKVEKLKEEHKKGKAKKEEKHRKEKREDSHDEKNKKEKK